MQYVVFGADGYIGAYLFNKLKADEKNVIGTSRREQKSEGKIFFDIQKGEYCRLLEHLETGEKTAIICIAEPNINRCFDNFDHAYDINVTKTKELIHVLNEKDFRVIFFSTDNVFDGRNGNYTEESHTHALNCYGRMKEEMEQYLLENESGVCIFRIPKVVATYRDAHNIFTEWERQSAEGCVKCIKGNRISFVCIEDIYHACVLAAEKKMSGLYHVVGDKDYSRAELAKRFLDKYGMIGEKVIETDVSTFHLKDNRPMNISMSNQKFKQETGYQFMAMDAAIEKYIGESKRKA